MKLTKKALDYLQRRIDRFIVKVLGCLSLQDYQIMICEAVAKHDKVAISSCHALGKTFTMARIGLALLFTHKNSLLITTAPTHRQVEMLLWGEIHTAYGESLYPLGGHLINTKLTINKKWYAVGFSPEKKATAKQDGGQEGSSFQGFHSDYVFVLFDEATGIPRDIWVQVEGLRTSGKKVKFICIGNPTSTDCEFYKCFSNSSWHTINLSCFDSPNLQANGFFTLEDIEAEVRLLCDLSKEERQARMNNYAKPVPYLITAQYVLEMAMPENWGTEHPLFITKILGEFDESSSQTLIKKKNINLAINRTYKPTDIDKRYIGLDVARGGVDSLVWSELIGWKEGRKKKKSTNTDDTMETVGDTINFLETGDDCERETILAIDATGIGSGVYDRLREIKNEGKRLRNVTLIELHYGYGPDVFEENEEEKPRLKKSYANLKSYMFDKLAKDVKNNLDLQKNPTRSHEMTDIRYKFNSKGQLAIESKDDYKGRTGKGSPDETDALMMANFARYLTGSVGTWTGVAEDAKVPNTNIEDELELLEHGAETFAGSISSSNNW